MARKYLVNTRGLNIRSTPSSSSRNNIIATLHIGDELEDLDNTGFSKNWMHIKTDIGQFPTEGYVASRYLIPKTSIRPFSVIHELQGASYPENNPTITRSSGSRAFPLGELGRPVRMMTSTTEKTQSLHDIIEWLDVENNWRYRPGSGKTYCNIYAYDYCYLAGVYLPRVWWSDTAYCRLLHKKQVELIESNLLEQNANALFNWLTIHGELFGWKRLIDIHEMQMAVNTGAIGLISAQNKDLEKPGHICMVVPETDQLQATWMNGQVFLPLQSQAGGTNRKYFTDYGNGKPWWKTSNFQQFGFWMHE